MTRILRSTLTALAVMAVALTSACGDDKGAEAPNLDGKWAVDSTSFDPSVGSQITNENRPWLQITGNAVNGFAGCNTFNTTVTYDSEKMSFEPFAMTRMACDDTANQIEAAFVGLMETVKFYDLNGQSLRMQNEDSQVILTFGSANP